MFIILPSMEEQEDALGTGNAPLPVSRLGSRSLQGMRNLIYNFVSYVMSTVQPLLNILKSESLWTQTRPLSRTPSWSSSALPIRNIALLIHDSVESLEFRVR